MNLPVLVLPEATAEVGEIFRWYENRKQGLGSRFLEALQACYDDLARLPSRQKRKGAYRHAVVPGFPYGCLEEPRSGGVLGKIA
ncbi:MAG: hypothetical protein J5I62_00480 [Flavobacteriales bacterium]|nr:hypothetical protein [Flavobacteriales bacterium]